MTPLLVILFLSQTDKKLVLLPKHTMHTIAHNYFLKKSFFFLFSVLLFGDVVLLLTTIK